MTKHEVDLGGVIVATTLAFKEDAAAPAGLAVDYDKFAAHCDWLMNSGCRGVGPNGSLGEYESLTDEERRKVIQVAVEAVDGRGVVIAGVHGTGWHIAKRWAQYAKEDGADGVLLLPPTITSRATTRSSTTSPRSPRSGCRSWRTTTRSPPKSI